MRVIIPFTCPAIAGIAFSIVAILLPAPRVASAGNQEYVTSSSPLPDGSVITTTVDSKTGKTTTTLTARNTMATAMRTQASAAPNSGVPSAVTPTAGNTVVVGGANLQVAGGQSSYLATLPAAEQTAMLQANRLVTAPTLGYPNTRVVGPVTQYPQPYLAQTNGVATPPYQLQRLPVGEVYPYPQSQAVPYAATPPTLSSPLPTVVTGASGHTQTFKPLLQLKNLPPGTYTGQGILGQPKAYVDGQPLRNLIRYLTY